ncbi:MAG: DUF1376 domain-containing protein [Sulfitobacter sp.]
MAEFPSLPLFTDAYIGDTAHLTNEEHGVYMRLLMFAWRSPACALPVDDKRLALMVGVTPKKWAGLKVVIMDFWDKTDAGWQQDRLTFERQRVKVSMDQKVAAGKASARAKSRKTKKPPTTAVASPEPTDVSTARQQPTPTPYEVDKSTSSQEAENYQRYLKAHPKPVDSDAGATFFSELIIDGEDPERIIGAATAYAETVKGWSAEAKVQQSDNFLDPERGKWKSHIPKQSKKVSDAEVLDFYSKVVIEKKPTAASTVSPQMACRLLAAKRVTTEQLTDAGVST